MNIEMERPLPRGSSAADATRPLGSGPRVARPSVRTTRWSGPWVIGAVAVALRWWMPGETIITMDEVTWLRRSAAFGEALQAGNLSGMAVGAPDQVATRPGITTMWTGELARLLVEPLRQVWTVLGFDRSPGWLRISHVLMALWCALGLVAFTYLARHLVGPRAALVAGGLLAVEPLLVGHSAILHTDALVATYAAVGLLGLVVALERARARATDGAARAVADTPAEPDDAPASPVGPEHAVPPTRRERSSLVLAALAGAAAGVAALTKLNSLALLLPGLIVLVVVHGARPAPGAPSRRQVAAHLGLFLVGLAVTVVVPWPSLWVDPRAQYRGVRLSATLADEWVRREVLLGRVTTEVDRRFYAVAAWYRSSAWLLVGAVLATIATVAHLVRRNASPLLARRTIAALTLPPAAYLLTLLTSAKHYDRYLLPLLPFVALGIAVAVVRFLDRAGEAHWVGRAGWAMLAAAACWTASLAPFAISHVNPLVGGQRAALTRFPLGWNEGIEQVLGRTHERTGRCFTIASRRWMMRQPGCWVAQDWTFLDGSVPPPELILIYVADRQRRITDPEDAYVRDHAVLVDALVIDGVTYVELWAPTR